MTRSVVAPVARGRLLLLPGQIVLSPETQLRYRIEAAAWRRRLRPRCTSPSVSAARRPCRRRSASRSAPTSTGWLREAYFGKLLDGHPRAIRLFDVFPVLRSDSPREMYYCLAWSTRRTAISAPFCGACRKPGPESSARREIAGILQVLGKLHRGQLLHRDLTPLNVFVCEGRKLKLGDFGIVRQQNRFIAGSPCGR